MTQKELLYLEDAISHEKNIISILKKSLDFLENEEIINFIKTEQEIHEQRQNKLISLMEEKSYE